MAETKVENQTCPACSADVRPGALFCYHCGSAVAEPTDLGNEAQENASPYKTGSLNRNGNKNKNNPPPPRLATTGDLPIGKPAESLFAESAAAAPVEKKAGDKKAIAVEEIRSKKAAAPARPKSRVPERNTVEVVWEEAGDAPGVWFVVVSILLVLLAVGIVAAAIYLR